MTKKKVPKTGSIPKAIKRPHVDDSLIDDRDNIISWHIGSIDLDGAWAWNSIDEKTFLLNILPKVRNFETMLWSEILNRNNHEIQVSQICKEAQKRLAEIRRDDIESLVSLRLSGKERILGIRYKNIFKVIWWDPNHLVYPIEKKHT